MRCHGALQRANAGGIDFAVPSAPLNKLLSSLRADAWKRIKPKLARVTLHVKQLLGASRPSVSVVIEDFQKRRILRAERGALVIGSREELLRVSCDCYQVIKENYEQVGR